MLPPENTRYLDNWHNTDPKHARLANCRMVRLHGLDVLLEKVLSVGYGNEAIHSFAVSSRFRQTDADEASCSEAKGKVDMERQLLPATDISGYGTSNDSNPASFVNEFDPPNDVLLKLSVY